MSSIAAASTATRHANTVTRAAASSVSSAGSARYGTWKHEYASEASRKKPITHTPAAPVLQPVGAANVATKSTGSASAPDSISPVR